MGTMAPELNEKVNGGEGVKGALKELLDEMVRGKAALREDSRKFGERERALMERISALGRACVCELLEECSPESQYVSIDGELYRREGEKTRGRYVCSWGEVEMERYTYRHRTTRKTLAPVEMRVGLVEGKMTPAAAKSVGELMQATTSRDAVRISRSFSMLGLSHSSFAVYADALGERWEHIHHEAEEHIITEFDIPENATSLSIAVDRISLPYESPVTRKPGRPRKNAPKKPCEVVCKMVYCGCWTLHDAEGKPLYTARYAREYGELGAMMLEESLRFDLKALLNKNPCLKVVTLADGALEMRYMLDRITAGFPVTCHLVDFWHFVEYLSKALNAVGQSKRLNEFKKRLKTDSNARAFILRRLIAWRAQLDHDCEALNDAIRYIHNRPELMDYAKAKNDNLPIGSGHVEATCKTVVSTRMKRPGARWKERSAQSILHLRSIAQSQRWEAAHAIVVASYQSHVAEIPCAA